MADTNQKQEELLNNLVGQAQQIAEETTTVEVGEAPANASSNSASKTLINISFIVVLTVGVVGSFITGRGWFDMDAYVKFIGQFAYVWAPLVLAVGGGRALKNFVNKKYK